MPKRTREEPAGQAIQSLFEQVGGKVYAWGVRLCGNPSDAEDLVQETFLRAYRKWHQFRGESEPTTWLYAIAVSICRRARRLRSGEPRHMESLAELLPSQEAGITDLSRLASSPHESVLRQEIENTVDQAISRLPFKYRLPLLLKEIAELTVPQIAAILGLKEATVKTRIHRGRLALRKELAAQLSEREAPPPDHARRVCLDLLKAKQEALDRGVDFPLAQAELCSRCRALFDTLDLARDTCRRLGEGEIPEPVRKLILENLS